MRISLTQLDYTVSVYVMCLQGTPVLCPGLETLSFLFCMKWCFSSQRNNVVDLLYYEQSLCLRCSHTERGSRVQEQLWTIRSKTSQNRRAVSHSCCTSHRRPVTFVLLIVLHFFKGLAGTIGHLAAFMWRKTDVAFLFWLFTFGEEQHGGKGVHLLAWLPTTARRTTIEILLGGQTRDQL